LNVAAPTSVRTSVPPPETEYVQVAPLGSGKYGAEGNAAAAAANSERPARSAMRAGPISNHHPGRSRIDEASLGPRYARHPILAIPVIEAP
jgi:hypothetical protein